MWRPCSTTSSPVLTTAVISDAGTHLHEAGQEPGRADATGKDGDHPRALSMARR